MDRQTLQAAADKIADEWQKRPYESLSSLEYPILYEDTVLGESVWVEIDVFERNAEFVQLYVCISHRIANKTFLRIAYDSPVCSQMVVHKAES